VKKGFCLIFKVENIILATVQLWLIVFSKYFRFYINPTIHCVKIKFHIFSHDFLTQSLKHVQTFVF